MTSTASAVTFSRFLPFDGESAFMNIVFHLCSVQAVSPRIKSFILAQNCIPLQASSSDI